MRTMHLTAAASLASAALLLLARAASGHYTNEWAVQGKGGELEAEKVAKELNAVVKGITMMKLLSDRGLN